MAKTMTMAEVMIALGNGKHVQDPGGGWEYRIDSEGALQRRTLWMETDKFEPDYRGYHQWNLSHE